MLKTIFATTLLAAVAAPAFAAEQTPAASPAAAPPVAAAAEVKAQLAPGASVYGSDGQVAGTVEAVDDQTATVNVGGLKARLPLSSFAKGDTGARIGMTAAELSAAVKAQTPASTGAK